MPSQSHPSRGGWPLSPEPAVFVSRRYGAKMICDKTMMCLAISIATLFHPGAMSAESKQPITAEDCVGVREIAVDETGWQSTIEISPDGKRVAYLVKSPNLQTNTNDIELYIRELHGGSGGAGKPVLVGDISETRWTGDSRHMIVLLGEAAGRAIHIVDTITGRHTRLVKAATDIVEYSADAQVRTIAYATEVSEEDTSSRHSQLDIARGYRISFPQVTEDAWPRRRVFVVRKQGGRWSGPQEVSINSPLNGRGVSVFNHAANSGLNLSLSPDGRALLIGYLDFSEEMSADWRASAFMKLRDSSGLIRYAGPLVLYDVRSGKTSVPLMTPWIVSTPMWSSDSKSFLVAAMAPIGTQLEKDDELNHTLGHVSQSRLFLVDPATRDIEVVASHLAFAWEGPLYWANSGEVFLRGTALNRIEGVARQGDAWRQISSVQLPFKGDLQVATNGKDIVGAFSDTEIPPELFAYQPESRESPKLVSLNPQLADRTFAPTKEIHWTTSTGYEATGLLLLPPDFVPGRRYPLVIQTKPFARGFACSFGHFPSFAPQPLANAGILYLGVIATEGSSQKEEKFYPRGYPGTGGSGSIAEAAFHVDLWDSGVKALDDLGLVDRKRIGIIGFSRTGWYTEFALAHSRIHFRAATVADNIQYSMGEYWLRYDKGTIDEFNNLYGGPPFGASAKNWLDYSVSFNLDKIHTPLLMEEMGHGESYENPNAVPTDLAAAFEVFTGLNVLGRPVELFYYPNEEHAPDHPLARLATLQRNVDWYRFWLQGYERPNPEDKRQYARWWKLRDKQADDNQRSLPAVFGERIEK
jgi:dipeptidyl aminopeptidase/acylaminoacyl peptidase